MTFSPNETSATLMVSTMDDNTTELSEYFVVVINSTDQPNTVVIGSPNMAFITIDDNDPGTVHIRIYCPWKCLYWTTHVRMYFAYAPAHLMSYLLPSGECQRTKQG